MLIQSFSFFSRNIFPVETAYIPWLLAGEGWHNYHHTFPWDYSASEYGASYNLPAYFIRFCARMGHAWDLRQANEQMIHLRAQKTGDGTPYLTQKLYAKNIDESKLNSEQANLCSNGRSAQG